MFVLIVLITEHSVPSLPTPAYCTNSGSGSGSGTDHGAILSPKYYSASQMSVVCYNTDVASVPEMNSSRHVIS